MITGKENQDILNQDFGSQMLSAMDNLKVGEWFVLVDALSVKTFGYTEDQWREYVKSRCEGVIPPWIETAVSSLKANNGWPFSPGFRLGNQRS